MIRIQHERYHTLQRDSGAEFHPLTIACSLSTCRYLALRPRHPVRTCSGQRFFGEVLLWKLAALIRLGREVLFDAQRLATAGRSIMLVAILNSAEAINGRFAGNNNITNFFWSMHPPSLQ